jgi:uncharacterized protein
MTQEIDISLLARIAEALERMAPPRPPTRHFRHMIRLRLACESAGAGARPKVNRVEIGLLRGIDLTRDILIENTERFAKGLPANNALLWGARGMGKSSLVKAAHHRVKRSQGGSLKLIEIHREDIQPAAAHEHHPQGEDFRFIVLCDDLSFDSDDTSYKSLKAALDGGIEGRPTNMVFYATSNRRHLLPRDMIENERSTAINPSEAVQEKVSLSDRFGLWLGFHNCSQDEFLGNDRGLRPALRPEGSPEELRSGAIAWQATRGSRSGRVAWQYIQDVAGRIGQRLEE